MATVRGPRAGVVVGRAAIQAKTAYVPPAHPSSPPSMPIATASSHQRKSVTPPPPSRCSTIIEMAFSTTPNLARAAAADPTDRRMVAPKAEDSADPLPKGRMVRRMVLAAEGGDQARVAVDQRSAVFYRRLFARASPCLTASASRSPISRLT